MDKKYVWLIFVDDTTVNRVFTNEEDAKRYASDYIDNTTFNAIVIKRKLNDHYIDWENRAK